MDRGGPLSVPSRMILCFRTRRTHSDGTRETGPETRKPALPFPSTARYKGPGKERRVTGSRRLGGRDRPRENVLLLHV